MPKLSRSIIVALLCSASSGCGLLLTTAPPTGHENMTYFTCTEGNIGPALDVVWAGLNVVGALIVAADQEAYESPGQAIAVGIGWGVLSGVSAGVGFSKTRRCREARRALADRISPAAGGAQPSADQLVQVVTVSPSAVTIAVGDQFQLTATALDSSGNAVQGPSFVWSSSNDAIASVGPAGTVTARALGSVVIAARAGSAVGVTNITVEGTDGPIR